MTTTPLPGLNDAEFDELARQVADHYDRDDHRGGERLYEQLHLTGIMPHMQRKLRWAIRRNVDADDVRGVSLLRIIGSLKAGKPVHQAMLLTIYRRSAWDIAKRQSKHEGFDRRRHLSDEELLEDLIDQARHDGDERNGDASVDFKQMRGAVEAHLRELKRPQWAELWLHWCEGVTEGPAIADRMNITKQKARRLKMELSSYLCGVGRHFFDHLDRGEPNR